MTYFLPNALLTTEYLKLVYVFLTNYEPIFYFKIRWFGGLYYILFILLLYENSVIKKSNSSGISII